MMNILSCLCKLDCIRVHMISLEQTQSSQVYSTACVKQSLRTLIMDYLVTLPCRIPHVVHPISTYMMLASTCTSSSSVLTRLRYPHTLFICLSNLSDRQQIVGVEVRLLSIMLYVPCQHHHALLLDIRQDEMLWEAFILHLLAISPTHSAHRSLTACCSLVYIASNKKAVTRVTHNFNSEEPHNRT